MSHPIDCRSKNLEAVTHSDKHMEYVWLAQRPETPLHRVVDGGSSIYDGCGQKEPREGVYMNTNRARLSGKPQPFLHEASGSSSVFAYKARIPNRGSRLQTTFLSLTLTLEP